MPTGHIPILQIKTKDGKWLPVNAIGGQVASKVLYNNAYPTVEQALDYLFENGTGGGGTGGATTAADVNYELPEEVQTEFPWAEIEENTVKAGLDTAIYYALAGMYAKYIGVTLPAPAGTVDVSLQDLINNSYIPVAYKAHEHDNMSILDEITAEKVNIWDNKQAKPSQVTSGTTITLADNTEYRLTDVTTLTLTYPTGSFECWMSLTFAASGTITVTLPTGTKYIGTAPDFKNGETWELGFKDKVLAAQKVGDGT